MCYKLVGFLPTLKFLMLSVIVVLLMNRMCVIYMFV